MSVVSNNRMLCDLTALMRVRQCSAIALLCITVSTAAVGQAVDRPVTLPEPFAVTIETNRLKLPEPFTVTVDARRLKLPGPLTVTIEAKRLKLPEPFVVTLEARRLKLPEPFTVTFEAKRLQLPDPFAVTIEAKRLQLPEPFAVTIEAKRLQLPEPFTITIEAKREDCGTNAEKQLAAATALIGRNALGSAENALNAIDRKLCPRLVPRIETEKARITQYVNTLIAEADAAARTCNIHAVRVAASKLQATEHPRLVDPRSRLSQLQTTIAGAEEAYLKAVEQYRVSDFAGATESYGRAKALLDGTGGACPDLGQRIASGLDKAQRTRDAIDWIDTALRSCDGRRMADLLKEVKAIPDPHPRLAEKITRLEKVAPVLTRFDAVFDRARDLFDKGDLAPAKSELRRLDAELETLGGQPDCPALREKVKTLIQNITQVEADLKEADDAILKCDRERIVSLLGRFRGIYVHRLIHAKMLDLGRAPDRCVIPLAEQAAKRCDLSALRAAIENPWVHDDALLKRVRDILARALSQCRSGQDDAACRAKFGDLSYAVPQGPNVTDGCACKTGYVFNPSKTRCLTPAQVMDEGHEKCRNKYGEHAIATGQTTDGMFTCGCKPGVNWNADHTSCGGPSLVGDAACSNQFGRGTRAIRQLPDGRWECQCPTNTKFDAGQKRCVPYTAADGHTACRNQFGAASYATRYVGNGVWDCYTPRPAPPVVIPQVPVPNYVPQTPQQRCHPRRDGRPGLHCY